MLIPHFFNSDNMNLMIVIALVAGLLSNSGKVVQTRCLNVVHSRLQKPHISHKAEGKFLIAPLAPTNGL